jgi:hypothetical protein
MKWPWVNGSSTILASPAAPTTAVVLPLVSALISSSKVYQSSSWGLPALAAATKLQLQVAKQVLDLVLCYCPAEDVTHFWSSELCCSREEIEACGSIQEVIQMREERKRRHLQHLELLEQLVWASARILSTVVSTMTEVVALVSSRAVDVELWQRLQIELRNISKDKAYPQGLLGGLLCVVKGVGELPPELWGEEGQEGGADVAATSGRKPAAATAVKPEGEEARQRTAAAAAATVAPAGGEGTGEGAAAAGEPTGAGAAAGGGDQAGAAATASTPTAAAAAPASGKTKKPVSEFRVVKELTLDAADAAAAVVAKGLDQFGSKVILGLHNIPPSLLCCTKPGPAPAAATAVCMQSWVKVLEGAAGEVAEGVAFEDWLLAAAKQLMEVCWRLFFPNSKQVQKLLARPPQALWFRANATPGSQPPHTVASGSSNSGSRSQLHETSSSKAEDVQGSSSSSAGDGETLLELLTYLDELAAAVAQNAPLNVGCNNMSCTRLCGMSELELVPGVGQGTEGVGGRGWCGGCQAVSYCSPECQKKAWEQHKFLCKKLKRRQGLGGGEL